MTNLVIPNQKTLIPVHGSDEFFQSEEFIV